MDELSKELVKDGDVKRAMREIMRNGLRNQDGQRIMGVRELMDRLRQQREQQLKRFNLDSVMDDLRKRLQDILDTERQGIDKRLQDAQQKMGDQQNANNPSDPSNQGSQSGQDQQGQEGQDGQDGQDGQQGQPNKSGQGSQRGQGSRTPNLEQLLKQMQDRAAKSKQKLDSLPKSVPGAVNELSNYDFMDPEAARKFKELQDMLKAQMMKSMLNNVRQGLQQITPEQRQRLREMLHEINKMMAEKQNGGKPDFNKFNEKFGDMFGENPPESFEELMEQMAQQMLNSRALLQSMSPAERRELREAMESSLDPETRAEMEELASRMEQMLPIDDMTREYDFSGQESLNLGQASEMMQQLQRMDDLEEQLRQASQRGDAEGIDLDEVSDLMGEDARANAQQLRQLTKELEEAGYIVRKGDKLELTARGVRKIGQNALKEVFQELRKERTGRHNITPPGSGGEITGQTRPFTFGDNFDIALERTVFNGVLRSGAGKPVRLSPKDFEINVTETITPTATAILLDQSRSMGMYGSFQAAKKVTLALQALINANFARDELYIVGFSDYALEIKPEDIPSVSWNAWVSGTNIHHALMLARKLLSNHREATRQIILITDGEPTSHLEGTRAYFSYPPSFKTIQQTLKEVRRCTAENITINTFMLENNYELMDFVDKLTKINHGRAFYSTPDSLGQYVLVDYLKNHRKRLSA